MPLITHQHRSAIHVRLITGTDTDVGKTWATAATAAWHLARGLRVHVDKPVQTGVAPGDPGDADTVAKLLGHPERLSTSEGVRLRAAMAPVDALTQARALKQCGMPPGDAGDVIESDEPALPPLAWHLSRWQGLLEEADVLLIEGAGGVTVAWTEQGETPADAALVLQAAGLSPAVDVVARPGLGTQNHAQLTLEHLAARGLRPDQLIVSRTSTHPDPVERANLRFLSRLAAAKAGGIAVIPDGAARLGQLAL